MEDLWPNDFETLDYVRAPVTILREQASLLGKKTRNLVEAEVLAFPERNGKSLFRYRFYLKAPSIDYRYGLFGIRHGMPIYPVLFEIDQVIAKELGVAKPAIRAKEEKDFIQILRRILNTDNTRQVVRSLLAQMNPEEITVLRASCDGQLGGLERQESALVTEEMVDFVDSRL